MKIREIMTRAPASCSVDMRLDGAAKLMIERDCGAIPVCDGARLIGIITDRDIACRGLGQGKNPLDVTVGEVMTLNVYSVREDDDVSTALRLMEENRVRRLPVTRGDGELVGIVAMADLVSYLPGATIASLVNAVSRPNAEITLPGR